MEDVFEQLAAMTKPDDIKSNEKIDFAFWILNNSAKLYAIYKSETKGK